MKPDTELVIFDVQDNGIASLTLNRPNAMNALNLPLMIQFEETFYKAEADPAVKAIVIRGAGKFFVAGADIKFFIQKIQEKNFSDIIAFTRKASELFLAIENCKKTTIAILDGLSLGGGSELALSCQAIISTDKGSMAFPETAIGIYPGLGGMPRLAGKIGHALAKYYVFTGKTISASDAKELGMVDHLVSSDDLEETITQLVLKGEQKEEKKFLLPERFKDIDTFFSNVDFNELIKGNHTADAEPSFAQSIIKILGKKAPIALKMANDIIDLQKGKTNKDAIEIELAHLEEIFSTQDALEGLSSAGKRKPNYIGK
ncbi:MAG: enoyl-CoA hydratase/isomerase family protein [Desulfobacula sp.]|uniref:enoyl-CoA hydratase/isomerase family protein n=1 Tax=Desulfobacula sp. TaxID=2593537 RepID=UPI0039B958A1|nr:enoyl-CoA hydratase/isomerase family protein [Desulfobacula sp.]